MEDILKNKIEYIKGVGPAKAEIIQKELNYYTWEDILHHFPIRYIDKTKFFSINELKPEMHSALIKGIVTNVKESGTGNTKRFTAIFKDETGTMELVWFKGVDWIKKLIIPGSSYVIFGKPNWFNQKFTMPHPEITNLLEFINQKNSAIPDSIELRNLKAQIRQKESLGATRFLGLPDNQVHFLNLPFYETGTIKKSPLSKKDIDLMIAKIEEIQPHQIYAAGDLADPHGTHKVCLDSLFMALKEIKHKPFMNDCWVWLYRGAWHEWEIHEIEMAVPMSPNQVLRKRTAIFYHQSQKDGVMFQGDDSREFWVRVEERNKDTAEKFKHLGLASYAAMEAFKRYHF